MTTPTYSLVQTQPTEWRDPSGFGVGMMGPDILGECDQCGAVVRNQVAHTEWHAGLFVALSRNVPA